MWAIVLFFVIGYDSTHYWVPMRDNVNLSTDVYKPFWAIFPRPAILMRTPYSRSIDPTIITLVTDIKGYILAVQSTRGYQDSEGEPSVFLTDAWGNLQDGYDAIEWLAGQDFSDGEVGMFGYSALGIAQYLASGSLPPSLVTLIPWIGAHDLYHYAAYPGGEFRKALVENWLSGLGTPHLIDSVANHPNYDSLWEGLNLNTRTSLIPYPMYHITGWFDIFSESQLEAFDSLQFSGAPGAQGNQKIIIGPWGHTTFGQSEQGDLIFPPNATFSTLELIENMFLWYDYWVTGSDSSILQEPDVKFYLMGDVSDWDTTLYNRWVALDTFPPSDVIEYPLYIHQDGGLSFSLPSLSDSFSSYVSDPGDPVPTIGGNEFIGIPNGYGPKDQTPILDRSDILVFTSDTLTEPIAVVGKVQVRLFASSSNLDTDFAVRLCDVYPDGRSILIRDGLLKARYRHGFETEELLIPGEVDTFLIDLWSTAYVFNAGHRIQVIISSTNYPRFEVNPQTGADFRRNDSTYLVAVNTIYHSLGFPSAIILPVWWPHPSVQESQNSNRPLKVSVIPEQRGFLLSLWSPQTVEGILRVYRENGSVFRSLPLKFTGTYEITFKKLPSGVFFIKFSTNNFRIVRKIFVLY